MHLLYTIGIWLYSAGIWLSFPFNRKAAAWVKGRRGLFRELKEFSERSSGHPTAWFHCASLGEFEQGRTVIEGFRERNPEWLIVLTFFSPSGYEVRKDYPGADAVFYLPLDTPRSARKFIRFVRPSFAVFVKYEFWFNFLDALNKKRIPVYFISALFRKNQHFFRDTASWQRKQLKKVSHFFVQDRRSEDLLRYSGISRVSISGDTRFDRVMEITRSATEFSKVESFIAGRKVFMAGSTWPDDEEKIMALMDEHPGLAFIIAPHETSREHLEGLMHLAEARHPVRYTRSEDAGDKLPGVLIIDTIGLLSQLYRYADIAYIGGGFGAGIHNILEAAAFGKPVIFGPNFRKFREAKELIEEGGAFPVKNEAELKQVTALLLSDPAAYTRAAGASSGYVRSRTGATEMILRSISD